MSGWFITTCKAFILTAFVCFTIGIFGNHYVAVNGYILGYVVTILACLLILTYTFTFIIRTIDSQLPASTIVYNVFMMAGPLIAMVCIASVVLYNILKYRSNIAKNNTGTDYIWYSESIVLYFFLQNVILFTGISDNTFETSGVIPTIYSNFLYLFSAMSLLSYNPLYKILNSYTTDGYENIEEEDEEDE